MSRTSKIMQIPIFHNIFFIKYHPLNFKIISSNDYLIYCETNNIFTLICQIKKIDLHLYIKLTYCNKAQLNIYLIFSSNLNISLRPENKSKFFFRRTTEGKYYSWPRSSHLHYKFHESACLRANFARIQAARKYCFFLKV